LLGATGQTFSKKKMTGMMPSEGKEIVAENRGWASMPGRKEQKGAIRGSPLDKTGHKSLRIVGTVA